MKSESRFQCFYKTVARFACYRGVTPTGQETDLSHLVERPGRLARNKLYPEIYDKQLHSKAKHESSTSLSLSLFLSLASFLFLSPHSNKTVGCTMGLLILTSMPISAIYPSSMGYPVVGRTTRNYRYISKTFFRCLLPPNVTDLFFAIYVSSRAINETPTLNETKSLIRGNIVLSKTSRPCRRVELERKRLERKR